MSEHDLLNRIEEQAVEIAELKRRNRTLESQLGAIPSQVSDQVILSMRRAAVNCGAYSSCAVANRLQLSTEKGNDR